MFFAAGACHMLAYAFLERYPHDGFEAAWIRPTCGHTGNHIVVFATMAACSTITGFRTGRGTGRILRRASQWWPGWSAGVVHIHAEALVSRCRAREYEGLWMKEPQEFLFDPLARARRYLQKFPVPPAVSSAFG